MVTVDELLPGVRVLEARRIVDARGEFVKTFHADVFAELGCSFAPIEEFYSRSHRGVVRGMHFQLPPHEHAKLVYCIAGKITDVVLDLRRNLPTYGTSASCSLSSANLRMLFIPPGVAHGFCSDEEDSVVVYMTSSVHAPSHDAGVRWDSFGFDWNVRRPVLSSRDAALPSFREFQSPF